MQGLPDPSAERKKFEEMLPKIIEHYVGLTDGHAFVLFTSYDLLKRMVEQLTPWMSKHNLTIYSQADGTPRGQLLETLKSIRAECSSVPIVFGKGLMCRAMHCGM